MKKEIRLEEIKKILLKEKVIVGRKVYPKYLTHKNVYKNFKTDSWDEIKSILIQRYPGLEKYFEEFPTSTELTYALSNDLLEAPKCPYCGKTRSFAFTEKGAVRDDSYRSDPYRKYYKTCGSVECSTRAAEDSCLENLGVKNPSQSIRVKEKKKETSLRNWKTENPMQNKEVAEKCFQSQISHYDGWYRNTEEYKESCKETNLRKRGVEHSSQDPAVIAKSRATQNRNHGGWYSHAKNEEWRKKSIKTQKRKYGKDWYTQTEEYHKQAKRKYFYENFRFDSSWELSIAIFYIEHNLPIEIYPEPIAYSFEFEGEVEHRLYFPDFKIDGKLIEVKGEHLMDEEGNLTSDSVCKSFSEKEKEHLRIRDAAKTQCMKDNDVIIWQRKDCEKYMEYVRGVYGRGWKDKFRESV